MQFVVKNCQISLIFDFYAFIRLAKLILYIIYRFKVNHFLFFRYDKSRISYDQILTICWQLVRLKIAFIRFYWIDNSPYFLLR